MTGGDSITVATRTVYNAGGVVQTVQPEVNSAQAAPGIIFMYTPTQENNFLFQVIRKITTMLLSLVFTLDHKFN